MGCNKSKYINKPCKQQNEMIFFQRSNPDLFSDEKKSIWSPYDKGNSLVIEAQYQEFLKAGKPEQFSLGNWKIDFKHMIQINENDQQKQRPIIRKHPSMENNRYRINRFDSQYFGSIKVKLKK